ncbi:MAG: GNAT family N-acetyltransferase [Phycisphaerae bacterium]|nr:GNAT family N-acetyltransferase [Phycisphaerae bacterium]
MSDAIITIRRAASYDHEAITRFNIAMALESEGMRLDPATAGEGVRAALNDPQRAIYYVAELSGSVVGQTMVTLEWSDWRNAFFWWIQSVYVEPTARGKGVFRALHTHIRDEAKSSLNICGLRLYVHTGNRGAQAIYRRLGMTECDYRLFEESWPRGGRASV